MSDDVKTTTGPTWQTVSLRAPLPPRALWTVLADPARHVGLDGSGMVRGAVDPRPLTEVGQVFTMAMSQDRPGLEDYRTENTVTELEGEHLLEWATTREGRPDGGQRWRWRLDPVDDGRSTLVGHTCDWTLMTDPVVLERVQPPRVSAEAMAATLRALVEAAGGPPPQG